MTAHVDKGTWITTGGGVPKVEAGAVNATLPGLNYPFYAQLLCFLLEVCVGERLIGFYEYLSRPTTWAWQITIFVV